MEMKGIFTGAKVIQGHDWEWGQQDGGKGKNELCHFLKKKMTIRVQCDSLENFHSSYLLTPFISTRQIGASRRNPRMGQYFMPKRSERIMGIRLNECVPPRAQRQR